MHDWANDGNRGNPYVVRGDSCLGQVRSEKRVGAGALQTGPRSRAGLDRIMILSYILIMYILGPRSRTVPVVSP